LAPRRRPGGAEARLRKDETGEIKAVLIVQVDTASGVVNDIPAIRKAMNAAGHGALLAVDTIASLGTMPFEMDAWGVDVAVTGSQKGLMLPPGLSFIAANDKAKAATRAPACARPIGTGPSAKGPSTTRNIAARRQSTCCSACASRSTCCSPRVSRMPRTPPAAGRGGPPCRPRVERGGRARTQHPCRRRARELRDHRTHE